MTAKKATHVANTTIQYNDGKGAIEIAKGGDIPHDFDTAERDRLVSIGAIRAKTDAENGVPAGYAAGTVPAAAGGALDGTENDALKSVEPTESSSSSSAEANADAPAVGNRTAAGRAGR